MYKPTLVKAVGVNRYYPKKLCFCDNCGCQVTFGLPHPDIRKNAQYCSGCYDKLFPKNK